jgi:hypothetical protein
MATWHLSRYRKVTASTESMIMPDLKYESGDVPLFTQPPRRVVFLEAHMHYIGQPRRCVLVPKLIEADG